MTAHIAAYKAQGRTADKVVRAVTSIRHRERVRCSHVEILQGPLWPGDDQWSIAASRRDGNRVRKKWINFAPDRWDVFELPGVFGAWETACEHLGKPYDTLGAALCVTPFARPGENALFCSELAAMCLQLDRPFTLDPHMIVRTALEFGARKWTRI